MALNTTSRTRSRFLEKTHNIQSLGAVLRHMDPTKPDVIVDNPVWPFKIRQLDETMTDEILVLPSSYIERKAFLASAEYKLWRRSFKNCSHKKESQFYSFAGSINYYDWKNLGYLPPYSGYINRVDYQGIPFIGQSVEFNNYEHPGTAWDLVKKDPRYISATTFNSARINNMMYNLTRDHKLLGTKTFSIANFLLEFKQTLTLVNLLKFKLSNYAQQAADKHLAYNFGLKPLIGDIEAIFDIVKNMNNRIDKWNAGILKGTKTYNTHITMSKEKFEYSNVTYKTLYSYLENHITGSYEVIVKGHCYFTPELIQKADIATLLAQFSGLRNPLGIVWEAIPFSFLIDWLYNVGKVLENFEAQPSILKITAQSFGYSVSIKGGSFNEFKLVNIPHQYVSTTCPPGYLPGGIKYHNYVEYIRVRIPPSSYLSLPPVDNGGFTLDQSGTHIALSASLLAQRVLR